MFKFNHGLILFTFQLLTFLTAHAQNDSTFLEKAISKSSQQPATEKVYVHLDKPGGYFFGDTIWYKAYTVIGQHHQLSALSDVLYVELISPKDSVINRQILHLNSGLSWGDIPLPRTLKQGSYRIRAYTNWMHNFPDYFYNQKIRIGGMIPTISKQKAAKNPDVQFFPEGGQLVNGVRSRVAIKSVGANGWGEDIKGRIEDNEGNIVADFATQHLGMGVFALVPESGKTYKAKINIPGEAAFTLDLPKAREDGYTLSINNSQKDTLYIKIAVNDKVLNDQKNSSFYIIAQCNGKLHYTSQGKLENLAYMAKVEKSRFPTGITQFTLLSQNGEPLAERIAFIQSADTLKLTLNPINKSYATRQKVKINLNSKDNNNKPANASFSIAVINESHAGTDENEESTILNNLLLTSDLRGNIEQPNYYFTNINAQKQADLDVLMLTQGYRGFEWRKILNNTLPVIAYQPEHSLEITGVIKTPSGKVVPGGEVTLAATTENLLKDTIIDVAGNFKFADLNINDTSTLLLRARKGNKGSNIRIDIKQPDYPLITKISSEDTLNVQLPTQTFAVFQQKYTDYQQQQTQEYLMNGRHLKEVSIKGYKGPKAPNLSNSASLNPGGADQVIMWDQLGPGIDVSDCLMGKLNGRAFGIDLKGMSVIVDGVVLGVGHVNDVNPNDIYSIEVLTSVHARSIYGTSAGGHGILVITLKRGGEGTANLIKTSPTGIITFPFIGYSKMRIFYSPKYTTKSNTKQDERTTIYWEPNIITDKDGNASLEYFNNDTKGTYRVVIEGIDDNGNLGRYVYKYEVK